MTNSIDCFQTGIAVQINTEGFTGVTLAVKVTKFSD